MAGYFAGARYDHALAAQALVTKLGSTHLPAAHAETLLRYLASLLQGYAHHRVTASATHEAAIALPDLTPLLQLLERQDLYRTALEAVPYTRYRLRNALDDVVGLAFGTTQGNHNDLVQTDPASRSQLRRITGKEARQRQACQTMREVTAALDEVAGLASSMPITAEQVCHLAEALIELEHQLWDTTYQPVADDVLPLVAVLQCLTARSLLQDGESQPWSWLMQRYRQLLENLYRHAMVPQACLEAVIAVLNAEDLTVLAPPSYGPVFLPLPAGCHACQPRRAGYQAGEEADFPDTWKNMVEHPVVRPGGWVPLQPHNRPLFCPVCDAVWLLQLVSASQRYQLQAMPASCTVLFAQDTTPERVCMYLASTAYRHGRLHGLRRYAWYYFERGCVYYEPSVAVDSLCTALQHPQTTIDVALDLLAFLRLVVRAAHAYRQTYPSAEAHWHIIPVTIAPALAVLTDARWSQGYAADVMTAARSEAQHILQGIARDGLSGWPPGLTLYNKENNTRCRNYCGVQRAA